MSRRKSKVTKEKPLERYEDVGPEVIDDHESIVDKIEHVKDQLPSRYSIFQYIIQTFREFKKTKVTYCLGFLACFIVVFVVALMMSVLTHAPVVFLKLAELESGEMDMYILTRGSSGYDFLNYTKVVETLQDNEIYSYSSPRHSLTKGKNEIEFFNPKQCDSITFHQNNFTSWAYYGIPGYTYDNCTETKTDCFEQLCGNSTEADTYLIDSKKEWNIGLGKEWPWEDNIIPAGQIIISEELHDDLDIHTGDDIYVRIKLSSIFLGLWDNAIDKFLDSEEGEEYNPYEDPDKWNHVYAKLNVVDKFKKAYGKISSDYGNVAYFEYNLFIESFSDYFHPEMPKTLKNEILNWDLYENSREIIFNYPPDERYDLYTDSNTDNINQKLVDFASELSYRLGFVQFHTVMVVLTSLNDLEIFSLFLGLILNIITFILLFLSILLIYSLLMVSIETRTFEMGILRMIGMTRGGVVQLLIIQAFCYAIPAWIIGIFAAQIGGMIADIYFNNLTGIPLDANLTLNAFIIATLLGFIIPIISSILPITSALGQNLHDAVDSRRSKTKAVEVRISRSEDKGLSLPLLLVGLFLTIFGFSIYYIIPLSLLAEQLALLLNMFFALLIMMLLGLVMLALNFQRLLEQALTYIVFWWDRPAIRSVVLKNLVAHRSRNRKTTIMYAISLGFIIFIYVSYDVQIRSFIYQEKWDSGTYLNVHASDDPYSDNANRIDLVPGLEAYAESNGYNFAWSTMGLKYVVPDFEHPYGTNIGHVFRESILVWGITPNFFDVAIPGFLQISDKDESSPYSILEQLYTPIGSGSAILGSLYKKDLGLSKLDSQFLLEVPKSNSELFQTESIQKGTSYHRLKPCAFLNGAPYFVFSQFPTIPNQDILVSLPTFLRLTEGYYNTTSEIPLGVFFIKLPDDISDKDLDTVKDDLENIIKYSDYSISVHDYRKNLDSIDEIDLAMRFFFGFTVIIAMAISFFSLVSSMYTNVHEQAKEIGILRALGIPYGWMQRIYIYEAFILVFSSSLMGMFIGTGVGWAVSVQRVLFTQLPVSFEFPALLFFLIFIMATIFSFISSYGPITAMMNRSVVNILRS